MLRLLIKENVDVELRYELQFILENSLLTYRLSNSNKEVILNYDITLKDVYRIPQNLIDETTISDSFRETILDIMDSFNFPDTLYILVMGVKPTITNITDTFSSTELTCIKGDDIFSYLYWAIKLLILEQKEKKEMRSKKDVWVIVKAKHYDKLINWGKIKWDTFPGI